MGGAGDGRSARAKSRRSDVGDSARGGDADDDAGDAATAAMSPSAVVGAGAGTASGGAGGGGARPPSPIDAVAPFSIADLPGASRLTEKEYSLCEYLSLSPLQYHQIKNTIVNISLMRGGVRQADAAQRLVHVEVAKIAGVYDFVISAGWAKKGEAPP